MLWVLKKRLNETYLLWTQNMRLSLCIRILKQFCAKNIAYLEDLYFCELIEPVREILILIMFKFIPLNVVC